MTLNSLFQKTRAFLVLAPLIIGAYSTAALATLPPKYQQKTAEEKRNLLWQNISCESYLLTDLPTKGAGALDLLSLFSPSFLRKTFIHESDEMPQGRKKLIHTFGSSAKVRLVVDTPSQYTGIFASGGIGIVRLSLAKQGGSYTPGMGLKILIDGKPSMNFQVMYSLDGQGENHNFFENAFTNIVQPPKSFALKCLACAFQKTVKMIEGGPENERTLPLLESASITSAGQPVTTPNVPYQLIFTPTQEARAVISPADQADLRVQLAKFSPGTVLYTVSLRNQENPDVVQIGRLILESEFIASRYSDEQLFFEHQHKTR